MLDEDKLRENLNRASHGQRLLQDELLMETFRKVKDDFTKEMVDARDDDKILKAHARLEGLTAVLRKLHHYLDDGQQAKQELEYRAKVKR